VIELCQRGREVDRSSRFADTALLISDGYGSSHLLRCRERTVTQIEKVALLDNLSAPNVSRETSEDGLARCR